MRRVVRWVLLFAALSGMSVWWVADRGDLPVGEALPPGLVMGGLLTVAWLAAARGVARKTRRGVNGGG